MNFNFRLKTRNLSTSANEKKTPEIKPVKITICTMVKNEDDVVRQWIEYHGKIFGYENLYIVDNFSDDSTYEICKEYLAKGIHLFRGVDYSSKGDYMTHFKNTTGSDIFIPMDIDEFICYHDKDSNSVSKNGIVEYLHSILHSNNGVFKMNYLQPINTTDEDGLSKFTHAVLNDYKNAAKTFVVNKYLDPSFQFDHGNHYATNDYIMSDLVLIHYHERSHEQVYKKCLANVTGLGYSLDLDELKRLKENGCEGSHRVQQMIFIIENPTYKLGPVKNSEIYDDWIDIQHLFQ
jgi:glycosyltransferase involved in cell wall biosynthesis